MRRIWVLTSHTLSSQALAEELKVKLSNVTAEKEQLQQKLANVDAELTEATAAAARAEALAEERLCDAEVKSESQHSELCAKQEEWRERERSLVQQLEAAAAGSSTQLDSLKSEKETALRAAQKEHNRQMAELESRLRGEHAKVWCLSHDYG